MKEERGAAATLAVFTIFVILCSVLAIYTFEAGYQRQQRTINQRMATDTTRAFAAGVEAELNDTLRMAIQAAMYEAGLRGREKSEVEKRLREYFNQRIAAGWFYSTFENIHVPTSDDNSLKVIWLPDGSLHAYGYLGASFVHVVGVRAYGIKINSGVVPRYGRMFYLAPRVHSRAREILLSQGAGALKKFEDELNENYTCERLSFELTPLGSRVEVVVYDRYGGRVITAEK